MDGSQGAYRSVSARKRPSCTIRGGGLCSSSPESRLGWTGVSCCLGWGSSLLDSSDLCGTASFSTPARQSEVSLGRAFGTLGHGQRAWGALCTGRVVSIREMSVWPFSHPPTSSWPGSGLVITPPASSICVPHASKGHALTHRQAISAPGLPGLSTARAPRTARLSSESSTNIQCGRIWRLRRICFTWEGRWRR